MIIDQLENADLYAPIHRHMAKGFHYLRNTDLAGLAPGRIPIEGDRIFAMVQEYDTKPRELGRWEAHRRYIDIQYVFKGVELFGFAHLERMKTGLYDEAKDFLSLTGEGDFFTLRAGTLVIAAPQDVHMPGIAVANPEFVKKIVVKVAVGG